MFGWFWSNPASPPLRFSSLYINVVQRWQTGGSNCWVLICLSSPTHWHRHNGYCQELLVGAWPCISAPASYSSCQHYRPRAQTLLVNLMTRSASPVKYISLISLLSVKYIYVPYQSILNIYGKIEDSRIFLDSKLKRCVCDLEILESI